MKDKINSVLPEHILTIHNSKESYIVDYKDLNGGDVTILDIKPEDIKCVHLSNPQKIDIYFDGFKDNALKISRGRYSAQCECVIFPKQCEHTDWILFVETKYANNLENAFKKENDYPHKMVNQIIDTVKFFRSKEIIPIDKRVSAIVSFPNLINEFNSTIFTGELSIEEILLNDNIIIRGTNSAHIISEKRIKLTQT